MPTQLPLPSVDPFDEPLICTRINREWMSFVTGALSEWKASLAFAGNTEEEDFEQRQRIYALEILLAQASEDNCNPMLNFIIQRVVVEHSAANNVAGGNSVATTWTALPMTAIVQDDTGASYLTGNTLTIGGSGLWQVTAEHMIRGDTAFNAKIRVVGGTTLYSVNQQQVANNACVCVARGEVYSTIGRTYTWQYWTSVAKTGNGLGVVANAGVAEIYGRIVFERIVGVPV